MFVGIDQAVTYGAARTPILPSTSGITDTGTTLLLIATGIFSTLASPMRNRELISYHVLDALTAYQTATGAVSDNATGILRLTPAQFANLESLFFTIGEVRY